MTMKSILLFSILIGNLLSSNISKKKEDSILLTNYLSEGSSRQYENIGNRLMKLHKKEEEEENNKVSFYTTETQLAPTILYPSDRFLVFWQDDKDNSIYVQIFYNNGTKKNTFSIPILSQKRENSSRSITNAQ